tara:strand:- start:158 stop:616 length:459 start_codon:yes stop_codon:yes gene_type:complete
MEYTDARKYNTLREEEQVKKVRIIREELEDTKTLDVGCGTGISSGVFSDVMGIDPSEELLQHNTHQCMIGKAEALPFDDNEFDNVIAVTSIHNFEDIEKGLLEMRRVGKHFGFSILKASEKFNDTVTLIRKHFNVSKEIDEGIDVIFIAQKN